MLVAVSARVPVPPAVAGCTVSVPSPLITPWYVVEPAGRLITLGPVKL